MPQRFGRAGVALGLVLIVAALACCLLWWRSRVSEPFLRYDVPAIKQSGPMNCWAATYAMLVSWKLRSATTERNAIQALGNPWLQHLVDGAGLPGGQELLFVQTAGLEAEPPANYTIEAIFEFLRTMGPLWIITGDGFSSHAQLMIGARGDKTYQGTHFIFIDPRDGKETQVAALQFFQDFEREAAVVVRSNNRVNLRWQILHWPKYSGPLASDHELLSRPDDVAEMIKSRTAAP